MLLKLMKIIKVSKNPQQKIIKQAADCLKSGGLVIYPTETVYGAGVDAANKQAVDKLLAYKARREGKPLSIAVNSKKMADDYVELNKQAENFYQKFLPGPYTIISKSKDKLPSGVASEFGTLGIRWPDHELVLKIVDKLGKPITSTSANASGKKRPYTIADILDHLSDKQKKLIDLIIDAGRLKKNPPSTVIDTTFSTPVTVRQAKKPEQSGDLSLLSKSEAETRQIAGKLMLKYWQELKQGGLIFGLNGQLGAGKTIFAKGIADFLKIQEIVTSPTYTYLKEYPFKRHQTQGIFYHFDVWKIDNQKQLETLQIKQTFAPNNVVAIEWWSQVKHLINIEKPKLVEIDFQVIDQGTRKLVLRES